MANLIAVKHNIEVAHRLYELPGKCEAIHGHSMWVTLWLKGELDSHGILEGLDFGSVKRVFRKLLDEEYDHHLLLNVCDPFAGAIYPIDSADTMELFEENKITLMRDAKQRFLPGLKTTLGDPTTENIAKGIGEHLVITADFGFAVEAVDVWETSVNMARWERDRARI